MIVGVTIWGKRISPVFDSSHMLLVAEISDGELISRRFEPFEPAVPFLLSDKLTELKIDVMICGAISMEPANTIEAAEIKLIPFIAGDAETVLATFMKGETLSAKYSMPGCGRRQGGGHCPKGPGRGRGCGNRKR